MSERSDWFTCQLLSSGPMKPFSRFSCPLLLLFLLFLLLHLLLLLPCPLNIGTWFRTSIRSAGTISASDSSADRWRWMRPESSVHPSLHPPVIQWFSVSVCLSAPLFLSSSDCVCVCAGDLFELLAGRIARASPKESARKTERERERKKGREEGSLIFKRKRKSFNRCRCCEGGWVGGCRIDCGSVTAFAKIAGLQDCRIAGSLWLNRIMSSRPTMTLFSTRPSGSDPCVRSWFTSETRPLRFGYFIVVVV